ncbi:hypothetical protein J4450_05505 [Candidatus Micrarchaeota archaeon]|nr:hypothetical protein [Candidatus Micrarchaeota archaeon]
MSLIELMKTKEYKDADKKVKDWKERLSKANNSEVMKVKDEKLAFFSEMRKSNQDLYSIFEINDKELSELIYEKLTGKKVIID